jgi:hypothetical protein
MLHYFSHGTKNIALVEVERNNAYIDKLYLEEARF